MPNWCDNELEISLVHQGLPHRSMAVIEAFRERNPLMKLYPPPGGEWNYDWCVQNWGTKWDIDPEIMDEIKLAGQTYLRVCFSSAWSPPTDFYNWLSKEHPDLNLNWTYEEPGCAFEGDGWAHGGEFHDDCREMEVEQEEESEPISSVQQVGSSTRLPLP